MTRSSRTSRPTAGAASTATPPSRLDRARRLAGPHRPPPAARPAPAPRPCPICCGRPRPRPRSAPTATRSALVDAVRPHAVGAPGRPRWRCGPTCSTPSATRWPPSAYREALDGAAAARRSRRLRVRLAQSAVMTGDLETAAAALEGLEHRRRRRRRRHPPGPRASTPTSPSDYELARRRPADEAQRLVLAGDRSWKVLDLVALQALLAHRTGSWFDRMRARAAPHPREPGDRQRPLRRLPVRRRVHALRADALRRGHRLARDLQATARRSGALRAAAFASALVGEAALLSGDLDPGRRGADRGERAPPRPRVRRPGEAHSLQRLAEVRLAEGDDRAARGSCCTQALPLARSSMIARHLLQRVFGTMILATPDPLEARAVVDRAESTMGWDDACLFCSIMLEVPAAIACARVGDLDRRPPPPRAGRGVGAAVAGDVVGGRRWPRRRPRWPPPSGDRERGPDPAAVGGRAVRAGRAAPRRARAAASALAAA